MKNIYIILLLLLQFACTSIDTPKAMEKMGFDEDYFCQSTGGCYYSYTLKKAKNLNDAASFMCVSGFIDYALIVIEVTHLEGLIAAEGLKELNVSELHRLYRDGLLEWAVVMRTSNQFHDIEGHAIAHFKGDKLLKTAHLADIIAICEHFVDKKSTIVTQAYVDNIINQALALWEY